MKKSVCVIHQSMGDRPGGAASVCAWVLQALCGLYDVFLFSPDESLDVERLNRFYGTSLKTEDVELVTSGTPAWMAALPGGKLRSLRLAHVFRELLARGNSFDLVVNTMNEFALPFPSVQYIHCPIRNGATVRELYDPPERWLRHINNALFRAVSGSGAGRLSESAVFACNSMWTAAAFKRAYGLDAEVVYPPAVLDPQEEGAPGRERERGFVAIGRLEPEKRLDEAIRIIDKVHTIFPDVHLHIAGFGNGSYADELVKMADERGYVHVHRDLPRDELSRLIRSHEFGLHTTRNEHFGMAPAEMASAGNLVFVHGSGGQVEVVDGAEGLIYSDADDAALKIARVLDDDELRDSLAGRLSLAQGRFTPSEFMSGINGLVAGAMRARFGHEA